jgi:hypothetical protein
MLGNDLTPEVPDFSGNEGCIVSLTGSGVDKVHIALPKFHTNKEVFTALVDECLFLKTQCVKLMGMLEDLDARLEEKDNASVG